jgi:hypothetical protein
MTLRIWIDGWGRVLQAPAIIASVYVVTLGAAVPLALVVGSAVEAHLGRSLAANAVAEGVHYDWWQEFSAQAAGVATTFTPAIIGFASTLDHLDGVLDAERQIVPIAALAVAYLLLWTFLSGGILDRYARQRPTRAYGFFGAAGACFWRLLRLALIAAVVYGLLFAYVHGWLLDDAYRRLTRDLSVERTAFIWRVVLYAVFGALLVAVNIVFDYARVRLVVEDRRSVVGALRGAVAFVLRHTDRVIAVYALNALAFVLLIAIWATVAPGAGGGGWAMWGAFAGAQLYLLARFVLKLQFLASQTALFQASLAHAGYTAAPPPVWPESPAADTIARGGREDFHQPIGADRLHLE